MCRGTVVFVFRRCLFYIRVRAKEKPSAGLSNDTSLEQPSATATSSGQPSITNLCISRLINRLQEIYTTGATLELSPFYLD